MGATPIQDTHVKRSSSMSFALRWKHETVRLYLIVGLLAFALIFMFFMLLNGTATKSVSVVLNGNPLPLHTKQPTVRQLLDEQHIPVSEHDRLSVPLDGKLKNGEQISIAYTHPVQLTADGETKTLYTTGKTVQSALQDLHIALGDEDKITPSLDSALPDAIQIVRVKKEVDEETVPIAFDTVKKNDPSLLKGREQTVQEGQEGSKVVKTENVYEDGKLVASNVVEEKVQAESVNKIVAVGTKVTVASVNSSSPTIEEISKNGVSFGYKSILNNVTLTAYSGGGITYTGTNTVEGETVAVDKNVIPLGWWIYIEGVGFRRAEDTGSGVKGNWVDVYYNDPSYAQKFGIKHGATVYIIGPKKPSTE